MYLVYGIKIRDSAIQQTRFQEWVGREKFGPNYNRKHLNSIYCVLGIVLSILHLFSHLYDSLNPEIWQINVQFYILN